MPTLEELQYESKERRRRMLEIKLARLVKQKQQMEAKLFIEEIPEPIPTKEVIEKFDEQEVESYSYTRKFIIPKNKKPTRQKINIDKVKEFNKKNEPVDVEKIKGLVKIKETKNVNNIYESAFTYKEDATRPQRHPAKYSNRKAIDDYI